MYIAGHLPCKHRFKLQGYITQGAYFIEPKMTDSTSNVQAAAAAAPETQVDL